ncbi:50S ribosomal protein L15 [Chloroflexota bacterium]
MRQHELRPPPGSRQSSKRVGRGDGSGHGTYSGRGLKGQKSRSGDPKMRPGFEGGQLPLIKRLPQKRGFTNIFRKEYSIVNVGQLNIFAPDTEVTPERLLSAGLVTSLSKPVKILGEGNLRYPLIIKAKRFSGTARRKIADLGGRVEEV